MFQRVLKLTVAMSAVAVISTGAAAEFTADEIVTKAYQVDGGRDGISRLTFSFLKPNAPEKKLVYTMVWKRYNGENGIDSKILFYSEFPPDDQGKAFLGYIYSDGRKDDGWMYLPELRMVRKMGHEQHRHDDDDFAHSDLTHVDLVPRKPDADLHRLVNEERSDGREYYVVVSVPKDEDEEGYPYNQTVKWISKDGFRTEQIDYYRGGQKAEKSARIIWKQLGTAWVWEQVMAEDFKDGSRTTLSISDIRINVGLKDQVFSARSLRNGVESVLR